MMRENLSRKFLGSFSVRYPRYPSACIRWNLYIAACDSPVIAVASVANAGIADSAFDAHPRYRYSARKVDKFSQCPDSGPWTHRFRENMYERGIDPAKYRCCDYRCDHARRS